MVDRYINDLSQSRLRELFHYSMDSGNFTRLVTTTGGKKGTAAGLSLNSDGYRMITIDGSSYRCHRLAFLYVEGEFPLECVDHINLDTGDNRWVNLRQATKSQNRFNTSAPSTNSSGVKGVHFNKEAGKWHAQITVDKKRYHLGYFLDIADAEEARYNKAKELHGRFLRG